MITLNLIGAKKITEKNAAIFGVQLVINSNISRTKCKEKIWKLKENG